jgi:WD40 repeat protein
VAISRDGKYIASGGIDGSAIIWDISMNDSHRELIGHQDAIENLTFSPDGKWLVTTSNDTTMKIWNVHNGNLLQDYTDFTGVVLGATFSPDGKLFAFSDETIHLWQLSDNSDGDQTGISRCGTLTIPNAISETFSPDGSQLAGISGNDIKIWDVATGRELYTLTGHTGWVMGLAFSPDGISLASTSLDGTVKIWSLSPGNETVAVSVAGAGYGNRVAYNPNGEEFITSSGDGTTTLWNAETGESATDSAGTRSRSHKCRLQQ